jgi:hypothetical protein
MQLVPLHPAPPRCSAKDCCCDTGSTATKRGATSWRRRRRATARCACGASRRRSYRTSTTGGAVHVESDYVTQRLKMPGFNPCAYQEVKIMVSKFAFKFDLYRYRRENHGGDARGWAGGGAQRGSHSRAQRRKRRRHRRRVGCQRVGAHSSGGCFFRGGQGRVHYVHYGGALQVESS